MVRWWRGGYGEWCAQGRVVEVVLVLTLVLLNDPERKGGGMKLAWKKTYSIKRDSLAMSLRFLGAQ